MNKTLIKSIGQVTRRIDERVKELKDYIRELRKKEGIEKEGLKNYKFVDGEVMMVVTATDREEAKTRLKKRLERIDKLNLREQVI